jgi:cytochrome c553
MQHPSLLLAALALAAVAAAPRTAPQRTPAAKKIDFTRDVRPILAGMCFRCHGPDDKARKAKLRLDVRADATKLLRSGSTAVVPHSPNKSELLERVTSEEDALRMPPPRAGKRLSEKEIAILRRWIAQGAPYAAHWSYRKPVRPALPAVRDRRWPGNPVDHFILARLEKEGLRPTPPADRHAILRRLSLDLTGLPPTLQDASRFLADRAPGAYERLVDRLLASPAYGERWAAVWLDLARYADSQGYANDPDRTIWSYRDWVIGALNANLPYDRFTIEQLAGDLLPKPTPSQLVATGFHRNTLTNTEGGTNPEEFRSAAIVDRVNTTLQVWMGTTVACAQCHNHKYDPISQKEYYQLYGIFNNTEDSNSGNDAPTLTLPFPGQATAFARLTARLADAKKKLDAQTRQVDARRAAWEKSAVRASLPRDVAAILAVPAGKRNGAQQQRLIAYHRSLDRPWAALDREARSLAGRLGAVTTTTPILREGRPRPTHIHLRGDFQAKGEAVRPGLPAAFPAPPRGAALNRLTLAKWLVDGNNPLSARVAVNRLWEELFGIGIVETSEEFGLQGELPSHPELLDWLATEYLRLGWDTKKMIRLIVTSATYRQGARVTEELHKRDPYNRLLARGPRVRLSAEAVRDQALFAGGLLSRKMYGPPVQPPQPLSGLSAAFGSSTDWQTSPGEDRHRRALYTRWRRNSPYPASTTFDAPERTTCNVRRLRTNTPLQALVTLNDPVFVESAQGLARRILAGGGRSTRERASYGFRLCLTRPPSPREAGLLAALFERARQRLAANPVKATALATRPLGPAPKGMNVVDLAAWTVVANVLLNLDETIAKR